METEKRLEDQELARAAEMPETDVEDADAVGDGTRTPSLSSN